MVPFAGYEMPVQYPAGILTEHNHTRAKASIFDVSHMGQVALRGGGVADALETLVPGDIAGLAPGRLPPPPPLKRGPHPRPPGGDQPPKG